MHARCERKWYLKYIGGWPIPFTVATQLGTKIHAMLENYFSTGKIELTQDQREKYGDETPDEIELVIDGLKHYPKRGPNLHLEKAIEVKDGVVPVIGFADLVNMQDVSPSVYDHKTTSAWKYTWTHDQLMTDPQSIIYTRAIMDITGAEHALFKHVYYLTNLAQKTGRTRTQGVVITREHNDKEFQKLNDQLVRMKELSTETDPGKAKPNYEACWDYGGCPFRYYCTKHKQGGVMGLFKDLKKESKDGASAPETKSKQATKDSAPAEVRKGAVNPPESATEVVEKPAKRTVKPKKASKAEGLPMLTQAVIACLPTATALVPKKGATDEAIVSRSVLLAKEVLRQTIEG